MFRTDDRQNVCALLAAPDGYRLDALLVTTYSLDLTALTAVLSAAHGQSGEPVDREWSAAEVAQGLLGLKHRVVVFAQQALVRFGRLRAARLLTLYDRFIVPVCSNAAFHPKVWVVRFAPVAGRAGVGKRYRLLCASRNLTLANTWECGVVLDGRPQRNPGAVGPAVGRFIRAVARTAGHDGRLARSLAAEVAGVRFETGADGRWAFMAQTADGPSLWRQAGFSERETEALVVSPFVTPRFLDEARRRFNGRLRIVSTQDELDRVVHGTSDSQAALRAWLTATGNTLVVVPEAQTEDHRLDLHAKVLFTRDRDKGRTIVGSANATGSAWGLTAERGRRNWEAMVEHTGREMMSAFERGFLYEDSRRTRLRPWVEAYRPQKPSRATELRDELEDAQRQFGAVQLELRWQPSRRSLVLTSRSPCPYDASRFRAQLAPYGLPNPDSHLQDATGLFARRRLEFRPAGPGHLSAFVLVQLQYLQQKAESVTFLVVAKVFAAEDWRDQRDHAVLRDTLGDREYVELLAAMLKGGPRSGPVPGGGKRASKGTSRMSRPTAALLEPLLRRWATDPAAFDDFRGAVEGLPRSARREDLGRLRQLVEHLWAIDGRRRRDGRR
jgi:hypothetical protein